MIISKYENASHTLDALQESLPDVLLRDINLPDINGIDLCKKILRSHPDLRIIAIDNFDETSFVKRMLKNGALGYLFKNTNIEELVEAISTVFKVTKGYSKKVA